MANDRHVRPDGTSAPCLMARFGTCRLCALLDRDGPEYSEAYRRRYYPAEFPGELPGGSPGEPPPGPSPPPSLVRKAGNLARAIVEHVAAGMPEADEATAAHRLATCRACPEFNAADRDNPTCNRCGCHLTIKVRWAGQRCPAGKW
jgi:hypothetical protein